MEPISQIEDTAAGGKHLTASKQFNIAKTILRDDLTMVQAGKQFGISRQRAQQILDRNLPNLFLSSELTDLNGKPRKLSELRRIFNRYRVVTELEISKNAANRESKMKRRLSGK